MIQTYFQYLYLAANFYIKLQPGSSLLKIYQMSIEVSFQLRACRFNVSNIIAQQHSKSNQKNIMCIVVKVTKTCSRHALIAREKKNQ